MEDTVDSCQKKKQVICSAQMASFLTASFKLQLHFFLCVLFLHKA